MTETLVLILGDQVSAGISSLDDADPAMTRILMAEVREEATYVPHHRKKIAFLFSAMRHFAEALRADGWQVDYTRYDDPLNAGSLTGEVALAVERHGPRRIVVTEPGEYRLHAAFGQWSDRFAVPVEIRPDTRFLATHEMFRSWAEGRKQLRMEYFYRDMRRATGLLMDGTKPVGGKWNFDAENRKPAKADLLMPRPPRFAPDAITSEVLALVETAFPDGFGDLSPFWFAVTPEQAQEALDHFVAYCLPLFGDYQDAMLTGERFLYHAVISHTIHAGLLDPLAVCRRVERAYHEGAAPLNAVEGFIRQIIGWREYVRGIYWLKMPDYATSNALEHDRPLPAFYWTGETDMACVSAAVTQTREEAYAHHIQRLMVTGNFALLAGVDPHAVHEWYLAVYADAYEWVEMPNTLGMSQFADGGVLGSKPYAASGNYINKMSDYCRTCAYDVKDRTGPRACPFNPLYWHFIERHRPRLSGNPRMAQIYRTWDRMDSERRVQILDRAEAVLADL